MRDDWATLVAAITPGTYRSTVHEVYTEFKDPKAVKQTPSVAVVVGDEGLTPQDGTGVIFGSQTDIWLLGYVRGSEMEPLAHDLKIVLGTNFKSHMTGTNRYRVMKDRPITLKRFHVPEGIGFVELHFTVEVFAELTTF